MSGRKSEDLSEVGQEWFVRHMFDNRKRRTRNESSEGKYNLKSSNNWRSPSRKEREEIQFIRMIDGRNVVHRVNFKV